MPSLPHEPAVKTESEYDNYTQRYTTRYAPAPEPQAAGPSRQQAGQRGVSGKRPMVHGVLPSAPTRKRSATEEDIDEQLLAEAEEDMDDLLPGPSRKRQPPSWGSAVSNGDTASGPMRFTAASKFNPKDTSMQVPDSALAGFASCSPSAATSVLPDALTSTALPAQNLIDVADEPPLSAEQQSVLRRVQAGESIFFTVSTHSFARGLIWPHCKRLSQCSPYRDLRAPARVSLPVPSSELSKLSMDRRLSESRPRRALPQPISAGAHCIRGQEPV